ncbi:MAG: aldehyde dehydrogenase family protein [Paracoccaceae bacterium]
MLHHPMTIAGRDADATGRIEVTDPATGQPFATVPDAGAAELDAAIVAARAAFPAWAATPWKDRKMAVLRIGEEIGAHAEELARSLTREQGKPHAQAMFEIGASAQWCGATASLDLPVETIEDTPDHLVQVERVPIGVVGAISPWNFPVLLSMWKIIPAILTGNTIVLKPSPFTPLTVLRIGRILRDILPAGVVNIITGGDALGPLMTAHPGFGKISFTGSTATGRRVMQSAAPTLKRITLELGGNDPALIFPDVDVAQAAEQVFWSAFTNSGQICVATKRAYVHEAIYDDFLTALKAIAAQVPMGPGSDQGSVLGPVQNRPQFDRLKALLAETQAAGAAVIQAGSAPDQGYFLPVTLVDNPPEDSRIVQEEQFGPILPLIRFSSEDEVVARANASEYGLACTIWTADEERARRIARQIEAGSVWINEALALSPFAAFGGHKQSGIGQENGRGGLAEFTNPRTITLRRKPVAA